MGYAKSVLISDSLTLQYVIVLRRELVSIIVFGNVFIGREV